MKHKADPSLLNINKFDAFHFACKFGHLPIVEEFVKNYYKFINTDHTDFHN